ncbi:MAG: type I DNA topoisomerase [Calditrichota bacterium]
MGSSSVKTLVIVESPAKAKTINKFLGKDYRVVASVGHVIDLPPKDLGVDLDKGFKPAYHIIKGKQDVLKRLKSEAQKTDRILLATDPVREGEAIAWLIAERLKKETPDIQRIEFNEITATAVRSALESPREINRDRVHSQQARRVLDRLVGYMVSPVLWQGIVKGLSAGRVQSVALRLICEREAEIENFVPVEHWKISAKLKTPAGAEFIAKLVKIGTKTLDPNKYRIATRGDADKHVAAIRKETFIVKKIKREKVNKKPPPPFITSTLQQDAARRFRMPTKQVMSVAQKLYEGIDLGDKGTLGLITCMRSDSTRISDEALKAVRSYIAGSYGTDYLPEKPVSYGSKKGAQDAHEAIRPTHISSDYEPRNIKKYLSSDEFKIYELIWKRFVACQMKPAIADRVTVDIVAGDYLFRTQGETIIFRGFLQAYQPPGDDSKVADDEEDGIPNIPADLKEQQRLELIDLILKQLFTKPPPRYTESSLVKTLDKLNIGRPSTYSQIIAA